MEARSHPSILSLGELEVARHWMPEQEGQRRVFLGCRVDLEELIWLVTLSEGPEKPGEVDSIRQRLALLDAHVPSLASLVAFETDGGGKHRLISEVVEGEPFLHYLARQGSPGEQAYLMIILDLIKWVRKLAANARVLSTFELDDFFLVRRDGGRLELQAVPVIAIVREEFPQSNYQMAKKWYEAVAKLLVAPKAGWNNGLAGVDPQTAKPMKKLLRDLAEGPEKTLFQRFEELEAVVTKELGALKPRARRLHDRLAEGSPEGFLQEALLRGFEAFLSENDYQLSDLHSGLSDYVFQILGQDGVPANNLYVLPPDSWFGQSSLAEVNRKMSHPFLKNHHNGIRTLSVYCEERRTILLGENLDSIPLPVLLSARQGLEVKEVMAIAEKVDSALLQFESAEIPVELKTPWQIEICPESQGSKSRIHDMLECPVSEWFTWDVKLRVELPPEYYLGSRRTCSWRALRYRYPGSFFPTFLAWILDWKRFDWALRNCHVSDEPLSWDESMESAYSKALSEGLERRQLLSRIASILGE